MILFLLTFLFVCQNLIAVEVVYRISDGEIIEHGEIVDSENKKSIKNASCIVDEEQLKQNPISHQKINHATKQLMMKTTEQITLESKAKRKTEIVDSIALLDRKMTTAQSKLKYGFELDKSTTAIQQEIDVLLAEMESLK